MIYHILLMLFTLTPFSADKVEIIKERGVSVVHLIGNVVIEDEATRIECMDARLYEEENYVMLRENVVISDQDGSITADHAQYHFTDNKGYLGGGVRLTSDEQVIRADSLFYDGTKQYVEMHNNVVIEDSSNDMIAYGGMGWYDLHKDIGHLGTSPWLELIREDKDPVRITATRFVLYTGDNMFYGYDAVDAVIDSITVYSDTFNYDLTRDCGEMINPRIVEKQNTMKGRAGHFSMKNGEIESFSVYNGDSEYHSDEGNINNVEGDTITILFVNGAAAKIIVKGGPHGVLQLKRGSDGIED